MTRRCLLLFALCALIALAQPQAPAFEVATVKPSVLTPGIPVGMGLFTYPGGRINASRLTLRALIEVAYGLEDHQLSGGPNWADNDRWDIIAQPPADSEASKFNPPSIKTPPTNEMLRMLQALLEERFQLKFRKETKEASGYALLATEKGAKLNPPKDPDEFRVVAYGRTGKTDRPDYLEGHNASMDRLALWLAGSLHRPVLNQTGIAGDFDFHVEYAGGLSDSGASLFTALQEDLGLKLVTTKAPTEFWIIESASRPTEN